MHRFPAGAIEVKWRDCLAASDFSTHYAAPEFFSEPAFTDRKPFAVLSILDDKVTGALTGLSDGAHVQSGLSVRPQIAFRRGADRAKAMANLLCGLLVQAKTAKLLDLFVWSDMDALVGDRFSRRRYDGVVMLDLSRGPDALFRSFSENKRTNIKKAIKYGVSVAQATKRNEISDYFKICADWSRRKGLPVAAEEQFHQTFELTGNRRLFLARHEGKVVAGVVIRFFPGGVMEYAANSSLQAALRLRPNDLLHWRAIEWGCREGLAHYSLGGTHLFLRKFGGEVVSTTRCRLDLSLFRRYAVRDWLAERADRARSALPGSIVAIGRSVYGRTTAATRK